MTYTNIADQEPPRVPFAQGDMARRMREHDWEATPLGPPAQWPESLGTLVAVMLSSSQPMFIVWGAQRTTLYNDAYGAVLAEKHPALGRPFEEIWQDIWEEDLKPIVSRAYAGESLHMDDITLTMLRKGYPEETHFSFSYTPVFGADGKVQGFFCPCLEITNQVLEERRVQLRSEMTERLQGLGDPGEIRHAAAGLIGLHLGVEEVLYAKPEPSGNRVSFERHWGEDAQIGHPGQYAVADTSSALADDVLAGVSFATPDALTDPRLAGSPLQASMRKFGFRALAVIPVKRSTAVFAALVCLGKSPRIWHPGDLALIEEMAARMAEASERARLEQARQADRKRLQDTRDSLALATAASSLGAGTWDFTTGTITLDARGREVVGLEGDEDRISDWFGRTHPDDRDRLADEVRDSIREQRPFDLQYRVVHRNEVVKHIHGTGLFEADETGRPLLGTGFVRDVTELVEAEQQQNLLMAELDHRVKNILALVQSIAQMTLRREKGGLSSTGRTFMGRIKALAQSHSLLARSRWKGAELHDLIHAIGEPYRGAASEPFRANAARLSVAGDDLVIAPKAAQTLTLAIHELLTNAAKYGALSTETGRIAVSWEIVGTDADRQLAFRWQDEGGPPIAGPPSEKGFGTLLIEGSLAYELGGSVAMDFAPEGLRVDLAIPLSRIAASAAQAPETFPQFAETKARGADVALGGASILVVEDDMLVARQTQEMLKAAGAEIVGPFGRLSEAVQHAASDRLDGAVLDINLHGQFVWPAARALQARGIPFVFATGYSDLLELPDDLAGTKRIEKPFEAAQLLLHLRNSIHPRRHASA